MSFAELRDLLTSQLERRVEVERRSLITGSQDTAEDEAYFKEVFAGYVL